MENRDDILSLWPELHKVVFENDKARVIKSSLPPGKKLSMHWHPSHVGIIVKGSRVKITKPNSEPEEVDVEDGAFFEGREGTHAVENIGTTTIEEYFIEFKLKNG